ncbi:MAG: hypothetical protein IJE89_05405 [Bacilli bacterium]|nr:hypothetical protein [Bacilli bacterium]MBQ9854536.1 hypothetical protein [Bacilli bacterium]
MDNMIFKDLVHFVDFTRSFDKKLGVGMEGTCYKKGKNSYKLYNRTYRDIYDSRQEQVRLLKFRDIQIDNFYFIRSLIFIRENIVGSVSSYADGVNCSDAKLYKRNLDNLINALNILKGNVIELSKNYIYIDDLWLENILYDNREFIFIDTSDYYLREDSKKPNDKSDDVSDIYRKNMTIIMKLLFKAITSYNSLIDNFIFAYLTEIDNEYKDYLVDTDLMIDPDTTIIGIRNAIQEGIGREITSFSNCRKDLLRIRKK